MPGATTSHEILTRAGVVSADLAGKYITLGFLKSQAIELSTAAFQQSEANGNNITTCKEHARQAAAHIERQVLTTTGEIDALLIEWQYIVLQLKYTSPHTAE